MKKKKYKGTMPAGEYCNHRVAVDRVDAEDRVDAFFKILERLRHRELMETHSQFLVTGRAEQDA